MRICWHFPALWSFLASSILCVPGPSTSLFLASVQAICQGVRCSGNERNWAFVWPWVISADMTRSFPGKAGDWSRPSHSHVVAALKSSTVEAPPYWRTATAATSLAVETPPHLQDVTASEVQWPSKPLSIGELLRRRCQWSLKLLRLDTVLRGRSECRSKPLRVGELVTAGEARGRRSPSLLTQYYSGELVVFPAVAGWGEPIVGSIE